MKRASSDGPAYGSFRDRAGFMFEREGRILRQINLCGRNNYESFMESGLYEELTENRLLVTHVDSGEDVGDPSTHYKTLVPEVIPFISYPYEWSFSQLRDAATLTLKVQISALQRDFTLKDGSAFNVQFCDGRPIFIDTLSFVPYLDGQEWEGYHQFCRHFVAPLLLMKYVDLRLQRLLSANLDGIPLDLASCLLPRSSFFSVIASVHIHLHARFAKGFEANLDVSRPEKWRHRVSKSGLISSLNSLKKRLEHLEAPRNITEWSNYTQENTYTDADESEKAAAVSRFLGIARPNYLWDLGGNTGSYSRIAADLGIRTVCMDSDPMAVDKNYRWVRSSDETRILPLVIDLMNPSAALGWMNTERFGIFGRSLPSCVMALALLHHLVITGNVPVIEVARFLSAISERYVIVEWIPPDDVQVQRLLTSRRDRSVYCTEDEFISAFDMYFSVIDYQIIGGIGRRLYLFELR